LIVPIIGIGLKHGNSWYPVEVYVDSGATYSVLHERVAERMGLKIREGKRTYVEVGDGGLIAVYLHEMEMQLGDEIFTATVGFSDKLGVGFNLLGRKSIFERFKICFDEKQKIVTFQRYED
jgi:predicted aspartyl protease